MGVAKQNQLITISVDVKNSDFIFLNKIEALIVILQKMKQIAVHISRNIEVQSLPLSIVYRYKIGEQWDKKYGADIDNGRGTG